MSKKTYRRELIEWMILVTVGVTLYMTGLHTQLIGQIQRVVLATGFISPDINEEPQAADFNFVLTDVNGDDLPFSELKGETIFLNFWATWCPPCIAEMPDIESLYQSVGDSVRFVMVSVDKDQTKAKAFVELKRYEMPIYFANSGIPREFQSRSIPTTFIISPSGNIVVKQTGMAQYDTDDFIEFLLALD
ncbi:MAG: TlpA family protein disulfide reductase [Cyclobacteriaceae bacterium]